MLNTATTLSRQTEPTLTLPTMPWTMTTILRISNLLARKVVFASTFRSLTAHVVSVPPFAKHTLSIPAAPLLSISRVVQVCSKSRPSPCYRYLWFTSSKVWVLGPMLHTLNLFLELILARRCLTSIWSRLKTKVLLTRWHASALNSKAQNMN